MCNTQKLIKCTLHQKSVDMGEKAGRPKRPENSLPLIQKTEQTKLSK